MCEGRVGAWWAGLPKVRGMGMRTMVYCTGRYQGYKTEEDRGSKAIMVWAQGAEACCAVMPASHQTNGVRSCLQ